MIQREKKNAKRQKAPWEMKAHALCTVVISGIADDLPEKRKSLETDWLQGSSHGRGRRIRTLNKGFGDPRVTITPCPCIRNRIDYTGVLWKCQAFFMRSYIIMPAATAAFRDSAPPRMGRQRRWVASSFTGPETPFPSLPMIRTKEEETSCLL